MAEVLPEDIQQRFLVTHFFNPPRYMRLVEIIPNRNTDPKVVQDMSEFLRQRLGKGVVFAKDTPNFVANRIGVYSIFNAIKHMQELDMTVEEVDLVAGPPTARPKTAAFRTSDLVGVDTLVHVGKNSYELLKDDEEREIYKIPDFLEEMVKKGLLGDKTGAGFYRKEKKDGKKEILFLDLKKKEYIPRQKPKFASVETAKTVDEPAKRLQTLLQGKDKAAEFAWRNLRDTLLYSFKRIPEIADDIVNVDNAMKWGFNWELGPFEMFDAIGVENFVRRAEQDGISIPEALKKISAFYKLENGTKYYYDILSQEYKVLELPSNTVRLDILKSAGRVVEENKGASLIDMGDGVFLVEFHSKMNSVGGDILQMIQKGIAYAEKNGQAVVIGNQGKTFSAGANLMLIVAAAAEGAYEDIDLMVRQFQKTMMDIKYSPIPVVLAPFSMTLGGAWEMCMHADAIVAHAETYMGPAEVGVGLLPAGGGTKELALRAIDMAQPYEAEVSQFIFKNFRKIAMAKISTSADEARELGYLRHGDRITMNIDQQLHDAKLLAISLAQNYRPSHPREKIPAPGRSIAASIKSSIWNLKMGNFVTEYEMFMANLIADVICGGDVPGGTLVSEQYFLDLEREAFLKLCGQKKTLERIQYTLKTGKTLRN
jgi:3-hydroxyacyl-CoA dehydrogenase